MAFISKGWTILRTPYDQWNLAGSDLGGQDYQWAAPGASHTLDGAFDDQEEVGRRGESLHWFYFELLVHHDGGSLPL